ncbi:MAG: phage major capsid protein, partial [Proteobacteria bacterium]|nr:phage major capsid protein [Pseudomonadota bacterium]
MHDNEENYVIKGTGDMAAAIDDLARAFETYKETNDRALAELKSKGSTDVVTAEKVARLDRALDELSLKARRPQLGGTAPGSTADIAVKAAFESYVRKGETAPHLSAELKSLSIGSNADGGYLVPPETEAAVNMALRAISPIRAIAGNRQVSSAVYKKPFSVAGLASGWVGETDVRPQTATPTLDALTFPAMELYAMPAASAQLLDDSAVNIDQWLAEEVRVAFAQQEGTAFVHGDGVNKPKGFLAYPMVSNASWSWGDVGTISTGVAGAFPTTNPADKLIDLTFQVTAGYRANGSFVMNRATQSQIRKFKDNIGEYIWEPASKPGETPSLFGYPVVEA